VCGSIERITLTPEGAAVTPDHEVLLHQQYAEAGSHKQVRTHQTANTRADDNRVVNSRGIVFEAAETPGQGELLLGQKGSTAWRLATQ